MLKTQETVIELLGNGSNLDLKSTQYYAAILGESPSKGAKSPTLWNKAFEGLGISAQMHPFDVANDRLKAVIQSLRKDDRFLGGAIAMPYKVSVVPFLDRLEPEAERIGAVNCIYREGQILIGANTDGAAALESLQAMMPGESLSGKTVAILGTGGAGSAVAAYIAGAVGPNGTIILANRTRAKSEALAARLTGIKTVVEDLPAKLGVLESACAIVNCTSIGFESIREDGCGAYSMRPYTPLGPINTTLRVPTGPQAIRQYLKAAKTDIQRNWAESLAVFEKLSNTVIYDIIYQPQQTMFLEMGSLFGLPTQNGLEMNINQAVIAFCKTMSAPSGPLEHRVIRAFMR